MKVTEKTSLRGNELVTICDFSPPRAADSSAIDQAKLLVDADFICVAYNPGRSVRVDSAMLAASIKQRAGKDVVFNLATRDMNKLAVQSHLLGAQLLGLENLLVVQGDVFTEKDLSRLKDVSDYKPTELMQSVAAMNDGRDFKGFKLKAPTDFCIGASIDLGRGTEPEAALTHRKAMAGAHFFLAQPVWRADEITTFRDTYRVAAGAELEQPVFWGLQILEKGGVVFSNVPERVRQDLDRGRAGTDIALEILHEFLGSGIRTIYLVSPILKGGARKYEAAQEVLESVR